MTPLERMQGAIDGRKLMIYGAGSQGRGLLRSLRHAGLEPTGFIDANSVLQGQTIAGLPVHGPGLLEQPEAIKTLFVVIATFFFEREIATVLESRGFAAQTDYLSYADLKPRDYAVEISGICNLRCISCPRADRRPAGRYATLMEPDAFEQVITKIRKEDPFVGNVQLYQWGEPTLHPDLPAMINMAREHGFLCSISSNLNHPADFHALITAQPECLRISVSGVEKDYEVTHTGGKWAAFLAHAETVGALRRALYPEMKVELYYHQYAHSLGPGQQRMAAFCKAQGFEFHPVPAYIISLDDVLGYAQGRPLPTTAEQARKLLLVDLDEGLRQAGAEADLDCDALRAILVNADLSVSACMMFYDPAGNTVADNYLETPLAEIEARRRRSPLCAACRKHGVHRYCGVYARLGEAERA